MSEAIAVCKSDAVTPDGRVAVFVHCFIPSYNKEGCALMVINETAASKKKINVITPLMRIKSRNAGLQRLLLSIPFIRKTKEAII